MPRELTIPGGRAKGTPIAEADDNDLNYWIDRIEKDLAENPEKKFADRDREWVDAAVDILERRGGGEPAPHPDDIDDPVNEPPKSAARNQPPKSASRGQPPKRTAPSRGRGIPADLTGSLVDAAAITERLRGLAENFNLISPATACSHIPEGCEVVFSFIDVDPTLGPDGKVGPDVYKQKGGALSLKGDTLDRIANAAGVTWLLDQCGRVDNRSDPRVAEYVATGTWQTFDGSWITVSKPKTIDLRDNSDQIEDMTEGNLAQKRRTINEIVESGARNRVIRKLGIHQSYSAAELAKPFCVVRLVFTGVTDDPVLHREFAMLKARQMTAGTQALYGRQQPARQLGNGQPAPRQLTGNVDPDGVVDDYED